MNTENTVDSTEWTSVPASKTSVNIGDSLSNVKSPGVNESDATIAVNTVERSSDINEKSDENTINGLADKLLNNSSSVGLVGRLFEPSRNSYFSKNFNADDSDLDEIGSRLTARLNSVPGFRTCAKLKEDRDSDDELEPPRRRVQFSEKSRQVIEEANRLLESIESFKVQGPARFRIPDGEESSIGTGGYTRKRPTRFSSEEPGANQELSSSGYVGASGIASRVASMRFPRVDFDDVREDQLKIDTRPAWKQLQDNIKDSYRKPKRSVERQRELNEMQDATLDYAAARRRARRRSQSPFGLMHMDGESFTPRSTSWMASGAIQPRGLRGSGPYCAPAVSSTAGLEAESQPCEPDVPRPFARYERLVDDMEARLWRTCIAPVRFATVTKREFERAPEPSTSFASRTPVSTIAADDENDTLSMPRSYYSRPDRRDPDYFDFDLQHSIDLYRKPNGVYIPRGPQPWENKLVREAMSKGDAPLSGYMFTRGETAAPSTNSADDGTVPGPVPTALRHDWRTTGTSYLSAALRTPSFWEHRFASIGAQVRDSNPVSMDSILRNKPVPSRFTEYRDPDFENYEDPREPE